MTDFGFSQLRVGDRELFDEKGAKGSALWMAPEVLFLNHRCGSNLFEIITRFFCFVTRIQVFLKLPFTEAIDVYSFGLVMPIFDCWRKQHSLFFT